MMTDWKELNKSWEQTLELWDAEHGYILRFRNKTDNKIRIPRHSWKSIREFHEHCKSVFTVTHYLICNPHPLADMICQQARTGQPVWVRYAKVCHFGQTSEYEICNQIATLTPDWNIPGAEYSFTGFKE